MNEITISREEYFETASNASEKIINSLIDNSDNPMETMALIAFGVTLCAEIEEALFGEEDSHD